MVLATEKENVLRPGPPGNEHLASPENERRHLYVELTGVPSSEKSTLARNISSQLSFRLIEEPDATKYPKFDQYYHDLQDKVTAFGFQTWILQENYYLINGVGFKGTNEFNPPGIREFLSQGPVVKEPPFRQNRLYAQARLEDDPFLWERYQVYYDGLEKNLSINRPDLLVYTRIEFPTMLERIRKRAFEDPQRAPELEAPESYWERLWELQEKWVNENSRNFRILTINTERFKTEEAAEDELLTEFLNQARYSFFDPKTDEPRFSPDVIIPEAILSHRPSNLIYRDSPPGGRRAL